MSSTHPKSGTILIAPLDWGLGHATRCIPLIDELQHLGCQVLIGAEGQQASLLRKEFPKLLILPLPGYKIKYSSGAGFGLKMLRQLPKTRKAIRNEKRWLGEILSKHQIDAIISDNRFGLYHPKIPSIIMTHQLQIQSPFSKGLEKWIRKINYTFLRKFTECWVVDAPGPENLAGILSHPAKMPDMPVKYLGNLSRFYKKDALSLKYDLLVLISGPEPQRSIFEKMILEQIKPLSLKAIIVSGQPEQPQEQRITDTIRKVNHLDSHQLNEALLQSKIVVSRSGYTTIMDLVKLHKKAILVPTPGQTEQEYLGQELMKKGYFLSIRQSEFRLSEALEKAEHFAFNTPPTLSMEQYKTVLRDFAASL